MMGCGEPELESAAVPGPPPEPPAPEPRAPVPEPGLDLSLSPLPESSEPRDGSPGRRFRNLVSLQVPEEQVLNAALRERLPPQARAPPPKEPPGPGPDMTVLCDPDSLCYESPHLTVDGLPPLRLQARTRPPEDTFLMHRTLRRWEA
uniref:Protein phosphatase 1 regulatory subunit 35 C-terminal domain-containing protein n=1 Tax=Chinchilla lanigera TaxID=34839 RepID=A0A8C2USD8_CHILA